jgi:D-ribose pyranase
VLSELQVEFHVVAAEMQSVSPSLASQIEALGLPGKRSLSHEDFKRECGRAKACIRTGECTPYANIILGSGVVFWNQ